MLKKCDKVWLMLLSLVSIQSYSQKIIWDQSYGGIHGEYLMDAIATADYGFILAGSSVSGKTGNKKQDNRGNLDYWIWKMNEHGEQEWQKSFGGSGRDLLYSIDMSSDGGYVLGGSSDSNATEGIKKENCKGSEDYWVVKLDAGGNVLWEKTLGGRGQDVLTRVISLKDGGVLLGGSSNSDKSDDKEKDSYGGLDFWVVKLDNKGKIEWERTLGGKYDDVLKSMIATSDGGYMLGGYTNSPSSDTKSTDNLTGDYWIVKLDKSGNTQWETTYGGEGNDELTVLLELKDGNYIAGGNSDSSPAKNGADVWLINLDAKGLVNWQKNYDIGSMDLLTSVLENPDSTLVLGIHSKGGNINLKSMRKKENIDEYVLLKISPKGEEKWSKNVGSGGIDVLKKVVMARDGGYVMSGISESNSTRGDRSSIIGSKDFWVVKLGDKEKEEVKKKSIEAFPNPAITYTNIIIGHDYEKGVATVFDLNGRQLQRFEIEGNRTIPVDLSGLPMGMYLIHIKTDVQEDGIKIMKK